MSENKENYSIQTIVAPTHDLSPVYDVLDPDNAQAIEALREELADNWNKKQIFRTETEMRVSVLNDAKHPTKASKYWQSVREMSAHFDGLMSVSFELKRNQIKKLRLEKELQEAIDDGDELTVMELKVDLEENLYHAAHMKQQAEDRVREIRTWSKLKSELDDGSFDSQNVNTHQAVSLRLTLENRVKALNPQSAPAEIMNAAGPFNTINRLSTEEGTLLPFGDPQKNLQAKEQQKQLKS